ncbi:hypothetical protein UA74_23685 [Actinoalloteichus fjordicus]|uniref:Uncharacterized protein n=1 Tax=Actinoalloteichus fjordicus TaxID=1612552 RepID=A0AAC9LH29_9PSEU|nr:hypothetical protein UA74_23685 [Actinoalloteichus fjordicus]
MRPGRAVAVVSSRPPADHERRAVGGSRCIGSVSRIACPRPVSADGRPGGFGRVRRPPLRARHGGSADVRA